MSGRAQERSVIRRGELPAAHLAAVDSANDVVLQKFPLELVGGQGGAVEVSLEFVAGVGTQERGLVFLFNSLGDHLHFQSVGHIDDGLGDFAVFVASAQFGCEGLIDLEAVEGEAFQVAQ